MTNKITILLPDAKETFHFDFLGSKTVIVEMEGQTVEIPLTQAEAFMIRDTLGGIRRFVDQRRYEVEKEVK